MGRAASAMREVLAVFSDGHWHNVMSETFLDERPLRNGFMSAWAAGMGWLEYREAEDAFWCRLTPAGRTFLAAGGRDG